MILVSATLSPFDSSPFCDSFQNPKTENFQRPIFHSIWACTDGPEMDIIMGAPRLGNGNKRPQEKASYGYKWQQSEGFHVSIPTLKWSIKLLICDQHQAYIGLWLTLEKTKILSENGQSSYKSHICFTFGGSKFLFDTLVVRFNVLVLVDYERWSTGVVTMTAHTGYHRAASCHVSA